MSKLAEMQEYVDKMKATSSTLAKQAILKEYKDNTFVRSCVVYALNPYWRYNVTSKQVKQYQKSKNGGFTDAPAYDSIFKLLDTLQRRVVTGHEAIRHILRFVHHNYKYTDLIYSILDKDIETRANATLVNKVWGKGFIPKFDVALAKSYDDVEIELDDGWYASRKLDGLRCICRIGERGDARFFTRKGLEFYTLDVLKEAVKRSQLRDVVLDGELCIMRDGLEDFKQISKEYNKKDHTISMPKFFVFDILDRSEFDEGLSTRTLMQRLGSLNVELPDGFELLEQDMVLNTDQVDKALDEAVALGHEGLILRKNVGYKGRRSNDILKVKQFKDAEYIVKQVLFDEMRFIEDGKDVTRKVMSSVRITHKGEDVFIGSGWSKQERIIFYQCPELILGKEITVRYKQESIDSNGKVSLQFPTVKSIYKQGRSA
jgi:DNA ligase-1